MKLKSVLCGMTFAGLAAGSAAVLAQPTTPPDQPGMAPSAPAYVVPSAPAVTTAPASGAVVTTPASPDVIWVPQYQSVPQVVVPSDRNGVNRYGDNRYGDPSYGFYHSPDLGW